MKHFVVDEEDKPLPVIVFSNINPTHLLNFLLHVALSLGEFLNELELFGIVPTFVTYSTQQSCTIQ
jgi:hypothetical protein